MSLDEHQWFPNLSEPALCAETDPELFFPEQGSGTSGPVLAARRICGACPAQAECLEWALDYPENLSGIWGGTSERERRKLRVGRPRKQHLIRHGGEDGAKAHQRRGEDVCPLCAEGRRKAQNIRAGRVA